MKISIIGAGKVGTAAAFLILERKLCDELILVDIEKEKALGEALDLKHATGGKQRVKVIGTNNYEMTKNSDVIVITGGKPRRHNQSRLDLANENAKIVREIVTEVMKYNTTPVIVVVTNPVDIMTYVAYKSSGLTDRRVIGLGTLLDTFRLRSVLADMYYEGEAYVIGEHGDSMVLAYGNAKDEERDMLRNVFEGIRKIAAEVIRLKGATVFAPAAAVAELVECIVKDERKVMPVCVYHEDYDICISGLAKIAKDGARLEEFRLSSEEKENFLKSVRVIEKITRELKF